MMDHNNEPVSDIPRIHPIENQRAMRAALQRDPDMMIEVWVTESGNLASVGLQGSHFIPLDTSEDVAHMADIITQSCGGALNLVSQVGAHGWPATPVAVAAITRSGFQTTQPATFWIEEQDQPLRRRLHIGFWAIRQAWGAILPIIHNAMRLIFKRPINLGEED